MLPFYGVTDESRRQAVVAAGLVHQMAKVLQEMNWATLADKMEAYDATNATSG